MAKTRRQRESDRKLARQGFTILALFVGVLVWGSSHSLLAGLLTFGLVLITIEIIVLVPGLVRQSRLAFGKTIDIDSLSWSGFEEYVASRFREMGYRARLTPTYDQGGDVIADGDGERIVVQVKHSTGPSIGNKAVQQAVAAVGYYKATRAMVVTNQYFTQSAIDLARANDVELWDRDHLDREMQKARPSHPPAGVGSAPIWKRNSAAAPSSSPTCPKCGAAMVWRHSKYGAFWGCSTFPQCRGRRQG